MYGYLVFILQQKGTLAEVTVSTFNLMHTAFTIKLEIQVLHVGESLLFIIEVFFCFKTSIVLFFLLNIQSDFNLIPDRGPVSVPSPASSSYSSSSASFRGSVPEGAEYAVLKLSGQSGGGGGTVDVYVQVIEENGFFLCAANHVRCFPFLGEMSVSGQFRSRGRLPR